MEIHEDSWLSTRFGHPLFTVKSADPEELRAHVAEQGTASYQAKVPTADVARASELCDAGFRVVCTAVTLRRRANAEGPPPGPDVPRVRPIDPERDSSLPELIAPAFHLTRFHLDPSIPNEIARRIKLDWIAAYVEGTRGEAALVAELDTRPAGFLGMVARPETRVIDLVGVAPGAQGRGAGTALIRRFCEESRDRCDTVEVGTQAANERSIRYYEWLGFETARTAYDLHLHVGSPWRS